MTTQFYHPKQRPVLWNVSSVFCTVYHENCAWEHDHELQWKLCFRAQPWTSMKVVLQSLTLNFNENCASEPDLELQWKLCFKSWSWTSTKVVLQILILNFIMWTLLQNWCMCSEQTHKYHCCLCLNFLHLLPRKPNLEKCSSYLNKFFHNFHLSESSITYPGLRASGLAPRLALAF
jgi:hypothetical protein